jgi:hypothetical protein
MAGQGERKRWGIMDEIKGIAFQGVISKITTTSDGGWRVSLDVGHADGDAMLALAGLRDRNLQVGIVDNSDLNAMRNNHGAWQEDRR